MEYRRGNSERIRQYKKTNNRRNKVKAKYGLTEVEHSSILEFQGNRCAICREPFVNPLSAPVDHCHSIGVVRGVLCQPCNKGLGNFRDNAANLASAVEYLREPPASKLNIHSVSRLSFAP